MFGRVLCLGVSVSVGVWSYPVPWGVCFLWVFGRIVPWRVCFLWVFGRLLCLGVVSVCRHHPRFVSSPSLASSALSHTLTWLSLRMFIAGRGGLEFAVCVFSCVFGLGLVSY